MPKDKDLAQCVEAWNASGLPAYRRTPASFLTFPRAGEVAEAMRWYTQEEILQAISNYAKLVKNREEYTWKASYASVGNFLASGVAQFLPGTFEQLQRPARPGEGLSPRQEASARLVSHPASAPLAPEEALALEAELDRLAEQVRHPKHHSRGQRRDEVPAQEGV
jgi:hypothetical protein